MVKVLDFGLVKDITADPGTSAQTVAGTPAYVSPEGVTDPFRVGPASDLYSLGVVGYRLLTGQHLFEAATEVAMCVQHASNTPTPPHCTHSVAIPRTFNTARPTRYKPQRLPGRKAPGSPAPRPGESPLGAARFTGISRARPVWFTRSGAKKAI